MFKASLLIVLGAFVFYFLFLTPGAAQSPKKSVTVQTERSGGAASGQTATQYRLPYSVISSGGREMANSSYRVMGTLGQPAVGETGNSYHKNALGFWYKDANLRSILGDVSGEGLANSGDALIILSYDVNIPIPPAILNRIFIGFGDTNSDNVTNSSDALIILSYDVGITVPFPLGQLVVPLPGTGPSPRRIARAQLNKEAKIVATAIPANPRIIHGEMTDVPVEIDLANLPEKVGSYTAALQWDTAVLRLETYRGGNTPGFGNPLVNDSGIEKGQLLFAHANPEGAADRLNILNLRFKVTGEAGAGSSISLKLDALAAARTFTNLLPYVEVKTEAMTFTVEELPGTFALKNYPNPFNPLTVIRYDLPQTSAVKIVIYNVLGQKVKMLVDEKQPAGRYELEWQGRNDQMQVVASGMYFLRMEAHNPSAGPGQGFIAEKKLLFLK